MTNNSGLKKKKQPPFDYLNKNGTYTTRRDFIETAYIKGVKNEDNEEVIRPLTKEETEWLSHFYAETEHANFKNSRELKRQTKKLKMLRREYKEIGKGISLAEEDQSKIDNLEQKFKELEAQQNHVEQLRAETNCFYIKDEDRREVYDRDNERRRDIYNTSKINNNLVYYDTNEYDQFCSEALTDIKPEDVIWELFLNKGKSKSK